MNNTLIFLRHAPTLKDPNVPNDQWGIKPESIDLLTELSNLSDFQNINLIYSSTKTKAIQTALTFANKNSLNTIQVSELGEIKKPGAEKLSVEDYDKLKIQILSDFNFSVNNSETANQALDRFTAAVAKINTENECKKVLIVSHGITMTLYFAKLQNQFPNILNRWEKLKFGNYGIIQNEIITKDII